MNLRGGHIALISHNLQPLSQKEHFVRQNHQKHKKVKYLMEYRCPDRNTNPC
jgi:hypothetical protein